MQHKRGFLVRDQSFIGFGICVAAVTIVQPTWAQVVQITDIEVQRRTDGVEVRLETSGISRLYVSPSLTRHSFNSFVVDIPNAQLRLPNRETFRIRRIRKLGKQPLSGNRGCLCLSQWQRQYQG